MHEYALKNNAKYIHNQVKNMPQNKYRRVPAELKEKILDSVKNDGISVKKASEEYGVSEQSIHKWLRDESVYAGSNMHNEAEIRRLKKDKEDLLCLI